MVSDIAIERLSRALRQQNKKQGWQIALVSLNDLAIEGDPAARLLVSDYSHLVRGGLSPRDAMLTLCRPAKGIRC